MSAAKDIPTLTPEQIQERTSTSEHLPLYYFNYARTASTFFDFRIFLGQSSVTPKGETLFHEQLAVAMAPEFAKTLRDNLSLAIEKYEALFGEVRKAPQGTNQESSKGHDGSKGRK